MEAYLKCDRILRFCNKVFGVFNLKLCFFSILSIRWRSEILWINKLNYRQQGVVRYVMWQVLFSKYKLVAGLSGNTAKMSSRVDILYIAENCNLYVFSNVAIANDLLWP